MSIGRTGRARVCLRHRLPSTIGSLVEATNEISRAAETDRIHPEVNKATGKDGQIHVTLSILERVSTLLCIKLNIMPHDRDETINATKGIRIHAHDTPLMKTATITVGVITGHVLVTLNVHLPKVMITSRNIPQ